jgi:hypothetical protein
MERRLSLESCIDKVLWAFCGKAKRKDFLSLEVYNIAIAKFWIDNTQVSSSMKDVGRRSLAHKSWESDATPFF